MEIQQHIVKKLEKLAAKGPKEVEAVLLDTSQRGYLVGVSPEGAGSGVSLNLEEYDRFSVNPARAWQRTFPELAINSNFREGRLSC